MALNSNAFTGHYAVINPCLLWRLNFWGARCWGTSLEQRWDRSMPFRIHISAMHLHRVLVPSKLIQIASMRYSHVCLKKIWTRLQRNGGQKGIKLVKNKLPTFSSYILNFNFVLMSHVAQYGENCESWDEACDTVNGTGQQSIPNDGEKNNPVKKKKARTKTKNNFKN